MVQCVCELERAFPWLFDYINSRGVIENEVHLTSCAGVYKAATKANNKLRSTNARKDLKASSLLQTSKK